MNKIDKVSMNVDFHEKEVMPLLHGTLELHLAFTAFHIW